jgi:hypothetical protein
VKEPKPIAPGLEHCRITEHGNGSGYTVSCKHCDWVSQKYKSDPIARRMASCHIVKNHTDIAKPAQPSIKPKRHYTPRQPKPVQTESHVNFCPGCGCNLKAVQVAMNLS